MNAAASQVIQHSPLRQLRDDERIFVSKMVIREIKRIIHRVEDCADLVGCNKILVTQYYALDVLSVSACMEPFAFGAQCAELT